MSLRILVAPSGFKESLGADEAADRIEAGILRALPDAVVHKAPLVDGGEGFAIALAVATGGTVHQVSVTGPVGQSVASHFGILGGDGERTAVLEMAAAAGLRLVPTEVRDPLVTTTYGVGELISAALDAGAERILVGCGDSGTNDGGAGMAQALGVRLLDSAGEDVGSGGGELARLERIDVSERDRRLEVVDIEVACNWHNVLCGENGVARVFGPQKGASSETVETLACALDRYADVIERDLGLDVRSIPGGGASGGLGAGLYALLGAKLYPRYEVVMRFLDLDDRLGETDLVITAEGAVDFQTPRGKIPAEVADRARKYGVPVIALAGTLGRDYQLNYEHGIAAMASILVAPVSLAEAIENAGPLLEDCAERVVRLICVGQQLGQRTG